MKDNDKWYRDGLRFNCTRCGKCCHVNGDYALVYITPPEARAMMRFLDIPRKEFMKTYCAQVEGSMVIRFVDDACPFLENGSCSVYKVRPAQCATWPFWEDNLDEWIWCEEVSAICPGVNRGRLFSPAEIERICRRAERADIESEVS